MSTKAPKQVLSALHGLIAQELTDVIQNGELTESGSRKTASAAYFANAIKFLKDNGIDAVATEGSHLDKLVQSMKLPEFDAEVDVHMVN